jgi:hypothetical protein
MISIPVKIDDIKTSGRRKRGAYFYFFLRQHCLHQVPGYNLSLFGTFKVLKHKDDFIH